MSMLKATGPVVGDDRIARSRPLRWIATFFDKIASCVVTSRQLGADAYINSYLRSCDDDRLATMGFDPEDIERIRKGEAFRAIRRHDFC